MRSARISRAPARAAVDVVHALFRRSTKACGLGSGIGGGLLVEEDVGQRLQPFSLAIVARVRRLGR